MRMFCILLFTAFAQESLQETTIDPLSICPAKDRETIAWFKVCVDYDEDRPAIMCNNCLTETLCKEMTDSGSAKCEWEDSDSEHPVCRYRNTDIELYFALFGVGGFIGMLTFGWLHYQYDKDLDKNNDDTKYWARKIRWLEYKADIKKAIDDNSMFGPFFWKNLVKWIRNELECVKMFFHEPEHYVSKFEALNVLMLGFWWAAQHSIQNQLLLARDNEKSTTEEVTDAFTYVTVPFTIISTVFFAIARFDEYNQVSKEPGGIVGCCRRFGGRYGVVIFGRSVIAAIFIAQVSLFAITVSKIRYVLNPWCTMATQVFYGLIYPQVLRLAFITVKHMIKWRIEVYDEKEDHACHCCVDSLRCCLIIGTEHITVNRETIDRMMYKSNFPVQKLREVGIHFHDEDVHECWQTGACGNTMVLQQSIQYTPYWYNPFYNRYDQYLCDNAYGNYHATPGGMELCINSNSSHGTASPMQATPYNSNSPHAGVIPQQQAYQPQTYVPQQQAYQPSYVPQPVQQNYTQNYTQPMQPNVQSNYAQPMQPNVQSNYAQPMQSKA